MSVCRRVALVWCVIRGLAWPDNRRTSGACGHVKPSALRRKPFLHHSLVELEMQNLFMERCWPSSVHVKPPVLI